MTPDAHPGIPVPKIFERSITVESTQARNDQNRIPLRPLGGQSLVFGDGADCVRRMEWLLLLVVGCINAGCQPTGATVISQAL
jgi:hypothetical protein